MKMFCTLHLLLILVIFSGDTYRCANVSADDGKYVKATLSAKWLDTPLLLEASEYIFRSEGALKFWSFVEQISSEQSKLFYSADKTSKMFTLF